MICYEDRGAGLLDRMHVLRVFSEMAVGLGVGLALPAPCRMFHKRHNSGKRVSCAYGWSRFFHIEDTRSGVPFRIHALNASNHGMCGTFFRDFFRPSTSMQRYLKMHTPPRVEVGFSELVRSRASKVKRLLGLVVYDVVHIRRTDAAKICNTDEKRMLSIFQKRRFASNTVLYHTDETSTSYNEAMLGGLKNRSLTVYDLDAFVRGRWPEDNFMTFAIEKELQRTAARTHEWRKTFSCPK